MPAKLEKFYLGDLIKSEYEDRNYTREAVTILAGNGADRVLALGTVLGKATKGAADAAPVAGNTGDGLITAHPAVGAAAKVGVYRLTCIKAAADGGLFLVEDPDGITIGEAAVGVEFNIHLTFTIADGAADFVVGDAFTIAVKPGTGKCVALDLAAADGTNVPYGVLLYDATAPDGADALGTALVRGPALLAPEPLVWPAGITADQKAAAIAILKAQGIQVIGASV